MFFIINFSSRFVFDYDLMGFEMTYRNRIHHQDHQDHVRDVCVHDSCVYSLVCARRRRLYIQM